MAMPAMAALISDSTTMWALGSLALLQNYVYQHSEILNKVLDNLPTCYILHHDHNVVLIESLLHLLPIRFRLDFGSAMKVKQQNIASSPGSWTVRRALP
jgi:hypothetical protein